MTKLSDSQAVILSAAAQRDDGAVLPLPETLKIKGGAVAKVLGSLKAKRLIDHQGTPRGDDPSPLQITRAGLKAIGVEDEEDRQKARRRPTQARRHPIPVSRRLRLPTGDRRGQCGHASEEQGQGESGQAGQTGASRETHTTHGHQAGAHDRLAQASRGRDGRADRSSHRLAAPHHSRRHRGAKKKHGLSVEATRTREVGPNKTGAKGSRTVYRITGSRPEPGSPPAAK